MPAGETLADGHLTTRRRSLGRLRVVYRRPGERYRESRNLPSATDRRAVVGASSLGVVFREGIGIVVVGAGVVVGSSRGSATVSFSFS